MPRARGGSPISRSTLANPNPWTRPKKSAIHARTSRAPVRRQQIVCADVHDAERDGRLDDARRRGDEVERGERQRDAVTDREGGHDAEQSQDAAAEQQQADDEEDVIGSDRDVMDARGGERFEDRERALTTAGVVLSGGARGAQDLLARERRPVS